MADSGSAHEVAVRLWMADAPSAAARPGWAATAPSGAVGPRELTALRLSGALAQLVDELSLLSHSSSPLRAAGEERDLDEAGLLSRLSWLRAAFLDPVCCEEAGNAGAHQLLVRATRGQLGAPWDGESAIEAAHECLSAALSTLGKLVSAPAVGAAEERARPLAVRVGREELLLRQVPEEAREAGQGERANERVGYRLWGAALVAASRVAAMGDAGALRGKRVLEIGAGLGLLGLLAARSRFGASCVCLSDFQGRIVDNLAYNAALNCVGQVAECRAACLDWLAVAAEAGRVALGEEGQEQEQEEPGGSAAAHSAFLDHGSRAGRFDVILGSDLVCEEPDCALVAAVIRAKLAQGGLALVTLGSQESRYGVACFAETIARSGLAIEELPVAAPRFCLPPAGGAALERDEVFIGTARAYRHFEVRLPPRAH